MKKDGYYLFLDSRQNKRRLLTEVDIHERKKFFSWQGIVSVRMWLIVLAKGGKKIKRNQIRLAGCTSQ